jgi:protein involved in polysaccharide export with SLBB domain
MTHNHWIKSFGWATAFAAVLIALAITGCSSDSGQVPVYSGDAGLTGTNTNAMASAPGFEAEVLQPGDSLTIVYSDTPAPLMPWEGEVNPEGTVTLLQNKTFKVVGLTRSELEKQIRDYYVPRFYKQMTVTIKPKQDTRFYYVGGDVRSPGRQVYLSRITILKAIQSAGDFTDFAKKTKVQLTRSGATKPIIVNCVKALQNPALDLEIYPGDRIHVPRKLF